MITVDYRNQLMQELTSARRPEIEAMCMVARFEALRPLEKLLLLLRYPMVSDLCALSHTELEVQIRRPLRKSKWNPQDLYKRSVFDAKWLTGAEKRVYWIGDADYPYLLKNIFDTPPVLFARGNTEALNVPHSIAVVGTRHPDKMGIEAAFTLAEELAQYQCCIVSGLALGIDAAAHKGAVAAQGKSVIVLGSGIDMVYPRSNRAVAAAVLDCGGVLISEYSPCSAPLRYHFPARNRIIAGLAAALVVVQAPEKSGALISVKYALNENREVMVHKAGKAWAGTASLLQQGALLVQNTDDVRNALSIQQRADFNPAHHISSDSLTFFGPDASMFSLSEARKRLITYGKSL